MKAIMFFFAVLGILFTIYFVIAGIHEYVHFMDLKKQNVEISEFVLLGWRKDTTSPNFLKGIAWISPESDYDKTFHTWWDCLVWC